MSLGLPQGTAFSSLPTSSWQQTHTYEIKFQFKDTISVSEHTFNVVFEDWCYTATPTQLGTVISDFTYKMDGSQVSKTVQVDATSQNCNI